MVLNLNIKGNLCPYYGNSNEDLEHIVNRINFDGKTVLSVLGSGMAPLEFLSKGAESIVAIDKEDIQLLWGQLYKSSIETLSYNEFRQIFFKKSGGEVLKNNDAYTQVILKSFGEELAKRCIEEIKECNYIGQKNLAYTQDHKNIFLNLLNLINPKYYHWAISENEYQKVKSKIKNGKLTLMSGILPQCLEQFSDSTFDVIYLSNIIEWFYLNNLDFSTTQAPHGNSNEISLMEQSKRILVPNGTIYAAKVVNNTGGLNKEVWIPSFNIDEDKYGLLITKK